MRASDSSLDMTFSALADPTRRAILQRLSLGEASVSELVEPFKLAQPTISKHLKVLERAGLIERRRDAQFRRCSLSADQLVQAWAWLGGFEQFWQASFDRLEVVARELYAQEQRAQGSKQTMHSKQSKPPNAGPAVKEKSRGRNTAKR